MLIRILNILILFLLINLEVFGQTTQLLSTGTYHARGNVKIIFSYITISVDNNFKHRSAGITDHGSLFNHESKGQIIEQYGKINYRADSLLVSKELTTSDLEDAPSISVNIKGVRRRVPVAPKAYYIPFKNPSLEEITFHKYVGYTVLRFRNRCFVQFEKSKNLTIINTKSHVRMDSICSILR